MQPKKFITLVVLLPLLLSPVISALLFTLILQKVINANLLLDTILHLWIRLSIFVFLGGVALWCLYYWLVSAYHDILDTVTLKWTFALAPILVMCCLLYRGAQRETASVLFTPESIIAFYPLLIIVGIIVFRLRGLEEKR